MKLFLDFYLLDCNDRRVLRLTPGDAGHMAHMRDVYAIIYRDRAPLRIVARDVLGTYTEIDI